ncbi:MAG: ceramidase domain-containing protein [Methylotenera sp.]|nr:ceramidase domain-containing protein [Oligoflexia bacterium]
MIQNIAKVMLKLLDYMNLLYALAMDTDEILENAAGCPWESFQPATIKYCEDHLCSWVKSPSDTWSCIPYVLVGIWIWKKVRPSLDNPLGLFGPICIFTGVFSALYHASFSFFFQMFDLASMFLFATLFLVLNLKRLGWFKPRQEIPFYILLNLISLSLVFLIRKKSGQILFGVEIISAFIIEAALAKRSLKKISYGYYFAGMGVFAIAYAFWFTDTKRLICDPNDHFYQGHAVWHIVNSFCFALFHLFYRQFQDQFRIVNKGSSHV